MLSEEQISLMRILEIRYANKPALMMSAYNNTKTCIVVVDMCEGFCREGALASPNADAIVPALATTLDFMPNAHKVFVVDKHTSDSLELSSFPAHCTTDRECAVVKPLARYAVNTVYKDSINGVFALDKAIKLDDYDSFIVTGCCTDICVLHLAAGLRALLNERKIPAQVIVPTDLVATYDAPGHNAVLETTFALHLLETAGVGVYKKLV